IWPGQGESMTFVRVAPKDGNACFLSTTEVSAGLFVGVLRQHKASWPDMGRLLPNDDDTYGIRTWLHPANELASLKLSRQWLINVPAALAGKLYPAGAKPAPPTGRSPVQQVSLAAAIYFARLLGCRLPTSAEWRAALEMERARNAGGETVYNLRDATWKKQKDHAAELERSGDLLDPEQYYPDAGIFWPKDIPPDRRKTTGDAVVSSKVPEDGSLWPVPVDAGGGRVFHHLIGNVAEFVFDDAAALAGLKKPTARSVTALLEKEGSAGGVIGGSAMSAPGAAGAPAARRPGKLTEPARAEGFSDVGFRLAFAAGRRPLRQELLKMLDGLANRGYLAPAGP
ncbi:MAG: SUMF1/EgtB/PvdO family nonheme iron enzyme, partial [Planctomycetes bacterium]|nr:SUMF1/EgtB/PvdO family nonheme iron enzyme [Planctomycetota bacterium]